MALHVLATFVAQDQHRTEVARLLHGLVEIIRADPGCLRCHLVEQSGATGTFVYIEEWQDKAALEKHLADPAVGEVAEAVGPLLAMPFTIDHGEELRLEMIV